MKAAGIRIRGIWIADVANQNQSGVLNEKLLGNDRKHFSRPFAVVNFLIYFLKFIAFTLRSCSWQCSSYPSLLLVCHLSLSFSIVVRPPQGPLSHDKPLPSIDATPSNRHRAQYGRGKPRPALTNAPTSLFHSRPHRSCHRPSAQQWQLDPCQSLCRSPRSLAIPSCCGSELQEIQILQRLGPTGLGPVDQIRSPQPTYAHLPLCDRRLLNTSGYICRCRC